jgi:esterase/lipase
VTSPRVFTNSSIKVSLQEETNGNFFLIHGAWRGGWTWKRVARQLREEGHEVYTPTLTGLADRRHLSHNQINLSTYIEDIVNLIKYEELDEVILCGASYS